MPNMHISCAAMTGLRLSSIGRAHIEMACPKEGMQEGARKEGRREGKKEGSKEGARAFTWLKSARVQRKWGSGHLY